MHRRTLFIGAAASLTLPALATAAPDVLGFTPDPVFLDKATALLKSCLSIDTHAHPGATFNRALAADPAAADSAAFEARSIGDMRAGLLSAGSFAAVADAPVLQITPTGIKVGRPFRPGEAAANYRRQIADLHKVAADNGLTIIRKPADLDHLTPGKDVGMILTVEGGDFLEGDGSRLQAARDSDDVRIITVVHYRPNELADNQTAPAQHGGLSAAGLSAVKEMARLGIVIDMAHAAETAVRQTLDAVGAPILCSHTHVKTARFDHPRFVTADTAKAIAAAGGVVGSWPSGFGGATLGDFADRIFALTEVTGPDHVALGTDMDGNYRPMMSSYRQLPLLVSELLRRGYGEANLRKLLGANMRRLMGRAWAAKTA